MPNGKPDPVFSCFCMSSLILTISSVHSNTDTYISTETVDDTSRFNFAHPKNPCVGNFP